MIIPGTSNYCLSCSKHTGVVTAGVEKKNGNLISAIMFGMAYLSCGCHLLKVAAVQLLWLWGRLTMGFFWMSRWFGQTLWKWILCSNNTWQTVTLTAAIYQSPGTTGHPCQAPSMCMWHQACGTKHSACGTNGHRAPLRTGHSCQALGITGHTKTPCHTGHWAPGTSWYHHWESVSQSVNPWF